MNLRTGNQEDDTLVEDQDETTGEDPCEGIEEMIEELEAEDAAGESGPDDEEEC